MILELAHRYGIPLIGKFRVIRFLNLKADAENRQWIALLPWELLNKANRSRRADIISK